MLKGKMQDEECRMQNAELARATRSFADGTNGINQTTGGGTPPLQLKQKGRILSSRNEVRDLCGNSYSRIIASYRIIVQRFFRRSLQNDVLFTLQKNKWAGINPALALFNLLFPQIMIENTH